ncbi:MAG: DUF1285 domain-containing protein [Pseudomonadales bacterium]|jgi:hypothetical protein|nr:DUF1285 domain-containing protein [Pseudomonadales bacterium]MDP7359393.1 DUF1285 domain-containing protein [Pseudomonadales bacterium]MDP7596373.1 DUF1285 domain-containing protein [Pseudomonadales bacterium]HJN48937.1 DUF1285 domain-containing protein [Pseudomonadales bacterium]|tara:strand:+ start:210 stop:770 length:561 start_codon:yes stop_codon:yes gene_type:complete
MSAAPQPLLAELTPYTDNNPPPLKDWHPQPSRDIDMVIDRTGCWFYEGSEVPQGLVQQLAAVLRNEGTTYYLVSPVEKYRITVEEAPFSAVRMDVTGEGQDQSLHFTTSLGDRVTLDASHPLRLAVYTDGRQPSPYILVRDGLEALLTEQLYFQLADLFVSDTSFTMLGVWSEGRFSSLCKASAVF